MRVIRFILVALIAGPTGLLPAADEGAVSAPEIMARVAANQDRAQAQRANYVYQQRIHVASLWTNGKLAREETTVYVVTPTPAGTKRDLRQLDGRYWHKDRYLDYHGEPVPEPGSLDGDLVHDFRHDLINESKDGLGQDLFPLTSEQQKRHTFELAATESLHDRKVYRVRFRPLERDELAWAGEAIIDAEEFEPVRVSTHLSRPLPFLVRTMLGTNLPGLGFNVDYRRFDPQVWFPVGFGTEFRLHVLYFINRQVTVSLVNSDFERAKVESRILQYQFPPEK